MPKDRYPGTALTDAINSPAGPHHPLSYSGGGGGPGDGRAGCKPSGCHRGEQRLPEATIYVAREVITMDPARPRAEAVAVVQGRIAAVGSRADIEKLAGTQDYRIDETFTDKVVIAGFVEQHVHPVLSSLTMKSTRDFDRGLGHGDGFLPAVRDEKPIRTSSKGDRRPQGQDQPSSPGATITTSTARCRARYSTNWRPTFR